MPVSATDTLTTLLDTVQNDGKAVVTVVTDNVQGQSVEIIQVQRPLDNQDMATETISIVVDPESRLPRSMETVVIETPSKTLGQAHAVFDYPPSGPATIYDLNVPADARIIDRRPKPGAAAQAQVYYDVTTDSDDPTSEALMLHGGVTIDLVKIPAGEFLMGSGETEIGYPAFLMERFEKRFGPNHGRLHPDHEGPQHRVRIMKGFYMSKFEITCGQFRRLQPEFRKLPHSVGELGGKLTRLTMDDDDQPACVPLDDAVAFCRWISTKTGLKVRLPSEAEWEYACRAGTQTRFYWGDSKEEAGQYANVADRTFETASPRTQYTLNTDDGYAGPAPVGQFRPNTFGLYDMIGNAPEWVQGIYGDNARSIDPDGKQFDPSTEENQQLFCRGGNWQAGLNHCRCASRCAVPRNHARATSDSAVGFRILIEE